MYQGFKFELGDFIASIGANTYSKYYSYGSEFMAENKRKVQAKLEKYLSPNGVLQASEIEDDWFPKVQADVFLSHSHKDEDHVLAFAGYLLEHGLKPFVDFTIWGYADKLLRAIDRKFFVSAWKPDGTIDTFSHEGSNYAASHVYLLLNSALEKMIDNTECAIFLETPQSLIVSENYRETTSSVWIYSELLMTKLVRRKPLNRSVTANFRLDEAVQEAFKIEYEVDLSHLGNLTMFDLNQATGHGLRGTQILDYLYRALEEE